MQAPHLCEVRSFIPEALAHSAVLPHAPVQEHSRLGPTTTFLRLQQQDSACPGVGGGRGLGNIWRVAVIPCTAAGLSNDAFTGANHHED